MPHHIPPPVQLLSANSLNSPMHCMPSIPVFVASTFWAYLAFAPLRKATAGLGPFSDSRRCHISSAAWSIMRRHPPAQWELVELFRSTWVCVLFSRGPKKR